MRDPSPDPPRIPEAARLSDSELVRLFVRGRESGDRQDWDRAVDAWHVLVARDYERIRGLVVAFRFPGHSEVRIDRDEIDSATHEALERCLRSLLTSFLGRSVGELRAAMRTATHYACQDHCRAQMRREQGIGGSIDDLRTSDEGQDVGRFDRELGDLAERRHLARTEGTEDLDEVAAAIEALPNENMRQVLRLRAEGYSSKEIAGRLELSPTNVDQLHSRGLRRLNDHRGSDA